MTTQTAEAPTAAGELRVLVLGPLRRLLQLDTFRLPFPSGGSQEAFWQSLLERFPEMQGSRSSVRLARGSSFLLPDDILNPGDELALIPPVSGG